MRKFRSPFGNVELTEERRRHILNFHPEVASALGQMVSALSNPDVQKRSKHNPEVIICYRYLPSRKKYLAVVVKRGTRNFILTAYLTQKIRT
jgi:hypothetical protein